MCMESPGKVSLVLILVLIIFGSSAGMQSGGVLPKSVEWEQQFLLQPAASFIEVIPSADGWVAVGTTRDEAGEQNVILVKITNDGQTRWSHQYKFPLNQFAYRVVEASDGGFLIAGTIKLGDLDYKAWVLKTDNQGVLEWNRTIVDLSTWEVRGLLVNDEGYYLSGQDLWLAHLDFTGELHWILDYSLASPETVHLVQVNDTVLQSIGQAGSFVHVVSVSPSGEILKNQTFEELPCGAIRDVAISPDKELLITAVGTDMGGIQVHLESPNQVGVTSKSGRDYHWIASILVNGTVQWKRELPEGTWLVNRDLPIVTLGQDGFVIISQGFPPLLAFIPWFVHFYLFDWNGTQIDTHQAPGSGFEFITDMVATQDHSFIAVGSRFYWFYQPSGLFSAWIAKLSPKPPAINPLILAVPLILIICVVVIIAVFAWRRRRKTS